MCKYTKKSYQFGNIFYPHSVLLHITPQDAISLLEYPQLRAITAAADSRPMHWADLGCGDGTFTLALAHFLAPGSTIEAIDLRPTIKRQTTANGVTILPRKADFVKDELGFAGLDGILMANSLHYVRDKPALLQKLKGQLRFTGQQPSAGDRSVAPGALLLIEYDTDRATPIWVPYPVSFAAASTLLPAAGWGRIHKLGTRPSAFGRSNLYAVLALSATI
jgi:SAM-dependent methyltransferase